MIRKHSMLLLCILIFWGGPILEMGAEGKSHEQCLEKVDRSVIVKYMM